MTMTKTMPQPERKLSELKRADEAARLKRALTGQLRPRTLHALCEQSARLIRCEHCGQKPGRACSDVGGADGYHLARFIRPLVTHMITTAEMATVLGGLDVFTRATLIKDGAR